jgi:tetratricopeptide (TPR) repeat protein
MGPSVAIGSLSFYWLGRTEQAILIHQEAIRQYRELNDTATLVNIYGQLGISLAGGGRYREAEQAFIEGIRLGREHEVWPFVARTVAMSAGYHLDLFDFAGNEVLAHEARELANSANFPPPAASAGIDLLLNYARRQEVGRAEKLLPEIAATVEKAAGFHGWLWRLRLAEAQAEIALARGEWEQALSFADSAIQQCQARGRVKYHILGLDTYARALLKLKRTPEAIAALQEALVLARRLGDLTVFLRPASTLLSIEGDDALHAEVQTTLENLLNAIPTPEMRRIFEEAELIQQIAALAR